ncbi:SH3 domain-containing protein [Desulforhopalus vacuolatus]|uniref:SH3 domain-containing protein n=1 Tax=Desulforhopalus vacuolatus TaxID=40414 RepID=UPI001963A859|nr:SH3 domain-containing protein [Desulforhopalus vacuolatus]MBM9519611.1 SH3 domain-containing protein [Desulforhopalus vacuolatus]
MKKTLCTIAVVVILALVSSPAFAAQYISVKVDNANVRTGPSTRDSVCMELFKGYPLKILQTQGNWFKVSDFENDTGWIHKGITMPQNSIIVNAEESMNMRSQPSTKSKVIASVERGVVLTKLQKKGDWIKVRHSGGTIGWIYAPLVWPKN